MNRDLEEFFYSEDGSFKPLTSNYGNTDGKLAHYRNTFMKAEREYFLELLKSKELREVFTFLIDEDDEMILREATKIQNKFEHGELETREELELMKNMTPEERDNFHMRKLELAEGQLCLLYAAVRDKVLIKELVKSFDYEEDKGMSIGR